MTIKEIIKDPATRFVDVRSMGEFQAGHVNGAINIPLDQIEHRYKEIEGLGKTPVVFYCRSGIRSGHAVAYLLQRSIKNVYNGGRLEDVQFYLN